MEPKKKLFSQDTLDAIKALYEEDSKVTEPRWKSNFPILDAAIPTFRNGLAIIGAEENSGKTNWLTTYYTGILDNTPNSVVVDFILDDSREERIRSLVAQKADLSITDVAIPGKLDPNGPKPQQRNDGYRAVIDYKRRLELIDGNGLDGKAGFIETIWDTVHDLRLTSGYEEVPLLVCVDAFDDVMIRGAGKTENESIAFVSSRLKRLSQECDAAVWTSKHVSKYTTRGAGNDAWRGAGKLKFDAKIGLVCYNDVGRAGQAAEIYFEREDLEDPDTKCPVFEVSLNKNKAGSFRGLITYFQFAEKYLSIECAEEQQREFRQMIYDQMGEQKKNPRQQRKP